MPRSPRYPVRSILAVVAALLAGACTEEGGTTAPPVPEDTLDLEFLNPKEDTGPSADDTADVEEVAEPGTPGPANSAWPMTGRSLTRTGASPFIGTRLPVVTWTQSVSSSPSGTIVVSSEGRLIAGVNSGNVVALNADGTSAWTFTTGATIEASPAIGADGAVYVGSLDGFFYALEPTGLLRWKYETRGAIRGSAGLHPDGLVVVGSRDKFVHATDIWGHEAWTFAAEGPVEGTPAIGADGTIIIGANGDAAAGKKPYVYALSAKGELVWFFETEGDVRAAPVIGPDGTVYVAALFGLQANLYAFTPSGTPKWKTSLPGGIAVSPVLGESGLLVAANQAGKVYGLAAADGTEKWVTTLGGAVQVPMAMGGDGVVYVACADTFGYALEPNAGGEVWKTSLGATPSAGPAILENGGVVVGAGASITVLGGGAPCEGLPVDCDDGNPCTEDLCEPGEGCVNNFLCDDGNDCTADSCTEDGTCTHTAVTAGDPCDDKIECTSGGSCDGTLCVPDQNRCGPAESSWPMRGRDAGHSGASTYPAAQTDAIRWTWEAGGAISSSPVLAEDGTLYVGVSTKSGADAAGALVAVSAQGEELWRYVTPDRIGSTPAVTDFGTIYVGCRDANLYAVGKDGQERWKYKTGASIQSSPTIAPDGTVYIGSSDGLLHAVRPNGEALWTFDANGPVSSTAALTAEGNILVGDESGTLHAIDAGGTALWSASAGIQIGLSAPVIDAAGNIYVGSFDKRLYTFGPDGSAKWNKLTGGQIEGTAALAPAGGVVFGSPDGRVYSYDALGQLRWNFQTNGAVIGSPAVGSDGSVYVGVVSDIIADFYVLDAEGKERFRLKLPGGVLTQPAIGKDGRIIVASLDGRVVALGGGVTCEGDSSPTCIDSDPCTLDRCEEGVGCVYEAYCDDANPCTQDLCQAGGGQCYYLPAVGASCDDGLACTSQDTCLSGACEPLLTACSVMESSWPMRGQNPQRTGRTTVNGPIGSNTKWIFDTDAPRIEGSGPVVAEDGSIYVGTCLCVNNGGSIVQSCVADPVAGVACTGKLFAIDADGQGKWSVETGDAIQTTPTIGAEGTIYVGNNAGLLLAIDPRTETPPQNRIKWQYAAPGQIRSSPALGANGEVVFGSKNGIAGRVTALSPKGVELWTAPIGGEVRTGVGQSASQAIIYAAATDGFLYALDAVTGQQVWKSEFTGTPRTTPLVDGNGRIYVGALTGLMRAFEPDGQVAFTTVFEYEATPGAGLIKSPVASDLALIEDQSILVPLNGQLALVDSSGAWVNTYAFGAGLSAGPLVDADGTAYLALTTGEVYALDAPYFKQSLAVKIIPDGKGPIGSLAVTATGLLLVTSLEGKLYALGP